MGLIGELNLHLQLLSRLPVIEVQPQVMHFRVQVFELDDVVHLRDAILIVGGFRKLKTVVQVRGVIPRRAEVVDVEHERLKQHGNKHQHRRAFQHVLDGGAMLKHEPAAPIGYVVAHRRHNA